MSRAVRRSTALSLSFFLVCGLACSRKDKQPAQASEADASALTDSPQKTDEGATAKSDKPSPITGPKVALPALPAVVAVVGGKEIPVADFERYYEPAAQQVLSRRDDGNVPDAYQAMQRRKIVEQLIWSQLMALEAERSGVDFEPGALEATEAEQKAHILDWPGWLQRIGQSEEIRRQANVDYLRERALISARVGSLEPTEEQLKAAYEANKERLVATEPMVRASHLLLAVGPRVGDEKIQPVGWEEREATDEKTLAAWDEATRKRALALREAVMAPGVDFNEFAREWSEGPGAFRGGDMGLFPRSRMVPEYAEVAFALEPGKVSEPVRSEKGYYVIKSFGRYEAGPLPFEAVRADLVRQLQGEIFKRGKEQLRKELEERFTIESQVLDDITAYDAARKGGPRP